MKNTLLIACALLAASTTNLLADDGLPAVRVESTRALKVAIVNVNEANPMNVQLNDAFAESMGFAISQECKMPIPVKAEASDLRQATNGMISGRYDFVVFIGTGAPSALINSDYLRMKAVPTSGDQKYVITLVLPDVDESFTATMKTSFPEALRGVFFQKALMRHGNLASLADRTDWKIALAANQ